jgi:cytochrome c peroxidase
MPATSRILTAIGGVALVLAGCAQVASNDASVPPPATADQAWRLPAQIPMPAENRSTPERVALGKALFYDQRLSGNGEMSCYSCHQPKLGWADGRKLPVLSTGEVLGRASPSLVNIAYNTQFMWDGRKKSIEDQAIGPHKHLSADAYVAASKRLAQLEGYQKMFAQAYPGEPINPETISKALAAFQRTLVSRDSPFDRWLAGDAKAITPQQYRGFRVFMDPARGNCAACHNGPNFTDNGYHNIGLRSAANPDVGRFAFRKVAALKGAFKTPTLRDIELTAPYFHDGSATTLREVVDHYDRGGDDHANLSPDVRPLHLSEKDKDDLVAFMRALTGQQAEVAAPVLPQ